MGDAEDLEILLKAAMLTKQIHRDVRLFSWAKALLVALVSGAVVVAGAAWTARGYVETQKECMRSEIKNALAPIVQTQSDIGNRLSSIEGTMAEHVRKEQ